MVFVVEYNNRLTVSVLYSVGRSTLQPWRGWLLYTAAVRLVLGAEHTLNLI